MAYCLRLPGDVLQLIEEMRCRWKDLAELKAAGGTPAARLIKTIIVENERWRLLLGETAA